VADAMEQDFLDWPPNTDMSVKEMFGHAPAANLLDDFKAERSRNVYNSHTIYVRAIPSSTSNDLHTVM
jgi:hypothetical protein